MTQLSDGGFNYIWFSVTWLSTCWECGEVRMAPSGEMRRRNENQLTREETVQREEEEENGDDGDPIGETKLRRISDANGFPLLHSNTESDVAH